MLLQHAICNPSALALLGLRRAAHVQCSSVRVTIPWQLGGMLVVRAAAYEHCMHIRPTVHCLLCARMMKAQSLAGLRADAPLGGCLCSTALVKQLQSQVRNQTLTLVAYGTEVVAVVAGIGLWTCGCWDYVVWVSVRLVYQPSCDPTIR